MDIPLEVLAAAKSIATRGRMMDGYTSKDISVAL